MSKKKKQKKGSQKLKETNVSKAKVVTTKKAQSLEPTKSKSRSRANTFTQPTVPLLFGRKNFMFICIGMACMAIGMLLMSGGHMPSPDIWDESIIYSPVRITVAPIMILLGLGFVLYSIFLPRGENA